MRLKEIKDGFEVYKISDEECRKLIDAKNHALKNTFPEKGKGYSVALMTKKGNIYEGVSYASDTGTLTLHSEASALSHAAIHGETEIVAITGYNCHICKQLIWESSLRSKIDIVIVVIEEEGKIKQIPISQMMPFPWPRRDGSHH